MHIDCAAFLVQLAQVAQLGVVFCWFGGNTGAPVRCIALARHTTDVCDMCLRWHAKLTVLVLLAGSAQGPGAAWKVGWVAHPGKLFHFAPVHHPYPPFPVDVPGVVDTNL